MGLTNLHALSATDAARLIRDGVISSEELVQACLARVRENGFEVLRAELVPQVEFGREVRFLWLLARRL